MCNALSSTAVASVTSFPSAGTQSHVVHGAAVGEVVGDVVVGDTVGDEVGDAVGSGVVGVEVVSAKADGSAQFALQSLSS